MFSDGVTEATNAEGEMFGDDRLAAAVLGAADSDIDALASRVVEEVDRFVAGAPQQDDLTVITAEVTRRGGGTGAVRRSSISCRRRSTIASTMTRPFSRAASVASPYVPLAE